jgi:MarR family transcriptional regulator, transcriptional regulator for hemolysin
MESTKNLQGLVGFSLQITARAWRKKADSTVARLGLSDAAGWALANLLRLGDGTHLSALAESMCLEGPSAARLLDNLAAAGLVERRDDPHDRRVKTLHLTASGQDICRRMNELMTEIRAYLLQDISAEDLNTVLRACRLIQARAGHPAALQVLDEAI